MLLFLLVDINIVAFCEPGGVSEAVINFYRCIFLNGNLVSSIASWNTLLALLKNNIDN